MRRLHESRKRKPSKLQNIFPPERGGNRFKSRALVQPSILMKAMALLSENEGAANYSATALRIASIGASRLNQVENESAPWYSNIDKPFAPRAPASSVARSNAVFDGP